MENNIQSTKKKNKPIFDLIEIYIINLKRSIDRKIEFEKNNSQYINKYNFYEGIDGNTCRRCSGNGTETCSECNGAGEVECNECDGNGEFETDELTYIHHYICTWDNEVKTQFKLNEKTNEPAMSEYDFDRLGDEYIVLMSTENNSELRNFVEINQVYCISYLNEINLIVSDSSSLNIYWSDYEDFLSYKL